MDLLTSTILEPTAPAKDTNLQPISEDCICGCCRKLICNPVTLTRCGHSFCMTCIMPAFISHCPSCRAFIESKTFGNGVTRNLMLEQHLNARFGKVYQERVEETSRNVVPHLVMQIEQLESSQTELLNEVIDIKKQDKSFDVNSKHERRLYLDRELKSNRFKLIVCVLACFTCGVVMGLGVVALPHEATVRMVNTWNNGTLPNYENTSAPLDITFNSQEYKDTTRQIIRCIIYLSSAMIIGGGVGAVLALFMATAFMNNVNTIEREMYGINYEIQEVISQRTFTACPNKTINRQNIW